MSSLASRIHPGEFLREDFLPDYGLDASELARRLGIPVEQASAVLAEHASVDAEMALRLSRLFGTSAELWMNLQREVSLAEARERLRSELLRIRPMSDTGWDTSRSADTEGWADWIARTSPAELLTAFLERDGSSCLPGLTQPHLDALASGAARFTPEDDAALCCAMGLSPGYWLRAQAVADGSCGIDVTRIELTPAERIRDALCRIEVAEDVRIFYAVESGSRAWGFASADSDYDVRFIYAHRPEFYISTRRRRDVIERPLERDLDLSGWDLPKALGLFGKSNPPLLEWLRSPTVYVESGPLAARLRNLVTTSASPSACLFHYLHMAEGNFREYLQGEQVWLKKYFYVLRPVLACRWIEACDDLPPVRFDELAEETLPHHLRGDVADLLARKLVGDELSRGPAIPAVSEFLASEIARLAEVARTLARADRPDPDALDALLHEILRDTWSAPCGPPARP